MSDRHDDDATDLVQAGVSAPAGSVRAPTVTGLPKGYIYGVTRYADVILEQSFARQYAGLVKTLEGFEIELAELQAGGGNRAPFVARFDVTLERYGWGKRNITIGKTIDGVSISEVRGHEIDMFATGSDAESYPGIAVEMEWNNKDPFFDRDLLNFQALHREGALAVGVIVTRGATLQELLKPVVLNQEGKGKYGESSTHWNKLVSRVSLGGGGECPLLLVGIEPPRVDSYETMLEVRQELRAADDRFAHWRNHYATGQYREAQADHKTARIAALAKLPSPTAGVVDEEPDD